MPRYFLYLNIMDRTQTSYLRLHGLGFMITIMILMAVVIGTYGQNVQVGEVSFEIGVEATVNCTFDVAPGEILYTVHWAASAEEPTSFPTDAIIIQYISTAPDPDKISVPNEEKYGGRVKLTDSYSLVINPTQEDFDTPWYVCQANVAFVLGFDSKEAAAIARGDMSSENTCTASSGSSQLVCKEDDTLTCTVDSFTPDTNFELDWNTEVIGKQGDLTISNDTTQDGYFTASRTLTIRLTEATEQISVFCTARGKAYMYAESGQLVGESVNIIVEGGNKGLSDGEIAGTVIGCSICVLGIGGGLVYYFVIYKKDK